MKYIVPKICKRCTAARWLCRNCGRRTCEHLCDYQSNNTALCRECQQMIAEHWLTRRAD
jgi:hypothetical protein